ncbi:MBL fold metallo-hydrolase [Actibacterium sp. 188UL27-1]|uniref:MBL fold metallo-hydrolase n=1 Tax=Actibacterium sp. 188UL27-1 TaxID=2786961 RepID=UPI001957963C|nr:MBL fold metallo-hydrolase [Actibacterium sp. 188UL27-1]MBM7069318.1 MBL fold metallo-hydrolase [Actibacterium sp. 188UL27-1]
MLCKIGEVEVWRILEIHAPFMTPEELWPDADADVSAIVEAHVPGGLCPQSGRLILPVQGFLLKTLSHTILVDSCVGNDKTNAGTPDWNKRSDTRFEAALTAAGVGFDDVDFVLCTHLHMDHVGWNTRLEDGRWMPTFPNARYLIPAADEEVHRLGATDMYRESVLPVIEAGQAELVQTGHSLGDEVTLVPTPGHTPGHVAVLIRSGGREAVITGDAMHSTVQCWHPDWHFVYDGDGEQATASRRQLLEEASETDRIVLGSHFALPSVGRVKAEGDAFRWEER